MIKQENISSGRLSSLRLPRDLSLGGTKPKKVYTPNLNVIRNKDKSKIQSMKTERSQRKSFANGPNHKKSQHDMRDRHKQSQYIQSEGIFSQGINEIKKSSNNSERITALRESNNASGLAIPRLNKNNLSVNKIDNTSTFNNVISDPDSESESDTDYEPVVLPLKRNKETFNRSFKIKKEIVENKIKKEPIKQEKEFKLLPKVNGHIVPDVKSRVKLEQPNVVAGECTSFTDVSKVYDEDHPALSLIRLPDSFFGKVYKDDPKDTDLDYTLKHMAEGQIGKIIIRKSGRMDLVFKNINYIINGTDTEGLTETAVLFPGEQSIALEPSLVTLGQISEKFTVVPDWNNLFSRAKKSKKFYW